MKGLWHLVKAIDNQIYLAALNIQKANVRGVHDIQRNAWRMFAELVQHCGKQGRLRVITGHDSYHYLSFPRRKLGRGLHGTINP